MDFARPATPTRARVVPESSLGDDPADPWRPSSLRLVCLDIDDTLIDFTSAGKRALSMLIGRADMWPLWERITDWHVARVVAGEIDYGSMHERRTQCFLAELGIVVDDGDAARFERHRKDALRSSWRLFDDVLPFLEWLRAADVLLAAVTNASGTHQRTKLADLGLSRFFDHVAIAGEVGAAKPDPVMFHSVCAVLDCDPSEAAHVGDKLHIDAVGARDAGMEGVWLDRAASDAQAPEGVHVIGGLDELPQLLVSEFARIGEPAQR